MAFPLNPTDGQQYTDTDGMTYTYVAVDTRWKRSGLVAQPDSQTSQRISNNEINIIKTNFKVSALQNASKNSMKNTVIDDYNDTTGIDANKSSGWTYDSTNKLVKVSIGQKIYNKDADWNSLTLSQIKVLNNVAQLAQVADGTGGNFGAFNTVDSATVGTGNKNIGVSVDSNGVAHVVATTNRAVSGHNNIDYFTITPSGTRSAIIGIVASTGADSLNPSIAVDSNGVSHIVFTSGAEVAGYNNVAYVTVDANNNLSPITWITNASSTSDNASIVVDSSNVSHIVFSSNMSNGGIYNIAYVTVNSTGTVSATVWATTDTVNMSLIPSISIDTNGIKHVVFESRIYNSSHWNIAYLTINGTTPSAIGWVTTSTTTDSQFPDIAVDTSGVSHIVFHQSTSSHQNIGYVTVSASGVISATTMLTSSTTADSQYAHITINAGIKHITFESKIYNATYNNIAYITINSSGVSSGITWLTTSTTVDSSFPVISQNGNIMFLVDSIGSGVQYSTKNLFLYQSSGTLTGTIDAGVSVTWNEFVITDTLPTNTSLSLTYQTSSDNTTWSTSATATSGTALSGVTGRYMKFVATLSTTDTKVTPTLTQLEVDWTNPSAIVVSTADSASSAPTQIIIDGEYTLNTGTVTFDISIDGGTTWTTGITPDTLTNITSTSGTSVVSRVTLTKDATITSLGYSWS